VIRVEPLDDADIDTFRPSAPVDLNFRRFYDVLVVVPRGGDGGAIQIPVSP
jgi:hypothetical protein